MEWFFVLVGVVILFGPIIWVFTRGRRSETPDHEDIHGSTAYGEFIRNVDAPPGQSGPGTGQGS
jgi:hypothetical protein